MISYFELLEMVKNENPPKKVKFGKFVYFWDEDYKEYDFEDEGENCCTLIEDIIEENVTEGRMIFRKNIEIID